MRITTIISTIPSLSVQHLLRVICSTQGCRRNASAHSHGGFHSTLPQKTKSTKSTVRNYSTAHKRVCPVRVKNNGFHRIQGIRTNWDLWCIREESFDWTNDKNLKTVLETAIEMSEQIPQLNSSTVKIQRTHQLSAATCWIWNLLNFQVHQYHPLNFHQAKKSDLQYFFSNVRYS